MLKTVGNPALRYGDQTIVAGNLVIGTAGKGIDFSADPSAPGMTSELLDDYEEGSWTPVITPQAGSLTSYSSVGRYTKVGRLVTVFGSFVITNAGTASGQASVAGYPFASLDLPLGPDVIGTGVCREYNMTGQVYQANLSDNSTSGSIAALNNGAIVWTNNYAYLWTITYQSAA